MKKVFFILLGFVMKASFLHVNANDINKMQSQDIIDYAKSRLSCNFSCKTHPEQTEFTKTDLMYLDIGQKVTKFYSRSEL